jgi:X-X-X-Leu-X-X-Gly heptad repeat protein
MQQDLQAEMIESGKGAPSGDAFVDAARNVAAMLRHDDKIQLVFMDAGGWDTHIAQGAAKGQLAGKLEKFASGLSTLADGLGPVYRNTVILIMSEFGRTVAENGNKGTDHGHGNVCWIMGGAVNGAKVHGRWPGLNGDQLWEGRDLAVTTDFRDIIAGVVTGHFGLSCAQARLFIPDYTADLAMQALLRT